MGNRSRFAPTAPATWYGYCWLVTEGVSGILLYAWRVCPIYDITWWLPGQYFTEILCKQIVRQRTWFVRPRAGRPYGPVHKCNTVLQQAVKGPNSLIIHESKTKEIEFFDLLLWISLTDALRSYIKHSKESFFRCPNTSKLVLKKTRLRLVFQPIS